MDGVIPERRWRCAQNKNSLTIFRASTVEQVEPDVGNIAELTKQLNKTNDFSLFVRSMRKKFQALC